MTLVTDLPVWEGHPFRDQVREPFQIYRDGDIGAIAWLGDEGTVMSHAAFRITDHLTGRDIDQMIVLMRAIGHKDQFHQGAQSNDVSGK